MTSVLGRTIVVEGDITGRVDALTVLGQVTGSVSVDGDVRVAEGAIIKADIKARNVDVHGEVVGNIRAQDRVEVTAAGRVTGDIRAPKILIDSGAFFKGNVALKD